LFGLFIIAVIVCRVHDHLLSLASPLVPDESGSSGGKTPIAAPPPTFASGNNPTVFYSKKDLDKNKVYNSSWENDLQSSLTRNILQLPSLLAYQNGGLSLQT